MNDTLPPRVRLRWLLMTMRLSIISLAGMARTLVAVGISSDVFMFLTTAAAAPRSTCDSSVASPCGGGGAAWPGCRAARRRRCSSAGLGRRRRFGRGGPGPVQPVTPGPVRRPVWRRAGRGRSGLRYRRRPCRWSVPGCSRPGTRASSSTDDGSSRNLRYISSTSHSFWPKGELVLLTAGTRLDSSTRQASADRLPHPRSRRPGRRLKAIASSVFPKQLSPMRNTPPNGVDNRRFG